MMLVHFTAVSAVVPSLLLLWWFHSRDLHPEPLGTLVRTFFLGVLTVLPVLLVGLPVSHVLEQHVADPVLRGWLDAFLVAAGPEELFKLLVVALYCARHKDFDEPMDGVVYGAVASLGFATLENVLYVAGGGVGVAVARALTAVPGHAFMGAVMGFYVGQAKYDPARRTSLLLKAYFVPFVLHGLYDAPLLALKELGAAGRDAGPHAAWLLLTLAVLLAEGRFTVRVTRALRADQQKLAALRSPAHAPLAPQGFAPADPRLAPPSAHAPYAHAPHAAPPYSPPYAPEFAAGATSAPPGSSALGVFAAVAGALLASVGGLVTLGVLVALASGDVRSDELGALLCGTALLGGLPLALGLAAFAWGLRRAQRSGRYAAQVASPAMR